MELVQTLIPVLFGYFLYVPGQSLQDPKFYILIVLFVLNGVLK